MIDFPSSPSVGQIFTAAGASWRWDGTKWVAYGGGSSGDVGRNLIHNPLFNIQQRGAGPWTLTSVYTADRWIMGFTGGTMSTQITAMTDANRTTIGDDAAVSQLAMTVAGGSGATDVSYMDHSIEDLHRTGGKTVTLSFWAAATAGTPKIGLALFQVFGTGGSPSGIVSITSQAVTISTTWTRYTATFNVPTIVGKTFGTAGDSKLIVRFALSAGATASASYGGIAVQSATFMLWGIQLESGSVATPLEKPDPQQDLAKCQRFYQTGSFWNLGYNNAGLDCGVTYPFPVVFRATPTITPTTTVNSNCAVANALYILPSSWVPHTIATATNAINLQGTFTASADL